MPRRELVAEHRRPHLNDPHLHQQPPVALVENGNGVHAALCMQPRRNRIILHLVRLRQHHVTPHQYGVLLYDLSFADNAALIQSRIVHARSERRPRRNSRGVRHMTVDLCTRIQLLGAVIGAKGETLEQAARHRIAIHDEAVVLIVARLRRRRNNTVGAIRHLTIRNRIVVECPTHGSLTIAEHVRIGVVAILDVRRHVADPLFALRIGELIARSLIVIGIRNHGGHEPRHGAGMNLTVAVFCRQLCATPPGDVGLVHLHRIAILYEAGGRGK